MYSKMFHSMFWGVGALHSVVQSLGFIYLVGEDKSTKNNVPAATTE